MAVLFQRTFINNPLRLKPVLAALASLVLALGIVSFERTKVWASPLTVWQDAVDKKPKRAKAYILLGVELAKQGSFEKAKSYLEEAVRLGPNTKNVEAYINLGNVYAETGDLPKAAVTLQKAIEINNRSMGAYMNLALVYLNMKDYDAAFKTYTQMAAAFPESPEILLMGADRLRAGGQDSAADRLLKLYRQDIR